MNPKHSEQIREFMLLACLLVVGRIMDFVSTYYYSPDLLKEGNPLVVYLHVGWPTLIVVNIIGCVFILASLYYDLFVCADLFPTQRNLSFKDFSIVYYFGKKRMLFNFLWRFPYRWSILWKTMGFVGARLLVFYSFLVALTWAVIHFSSFFRKLYNIVYPYGLLCVLIITVIIMHLLFFKREYQAYLSRQVGDAQ